MALKRIISAALAAALVLGTGAPLGRYGSLIGSAADKARVSVHDPSVIKADNGKYYVFGSHIDAARSDDLQSWVRFTNGYATTNNAEFGNLSQNLKKAFDWAGEDLEDCKGGFAVWAPDVVWNADYINEDGSKGAYLMYFCTSSTYMRSVIAYAASKTIEGPYKFVDTLIYSGFTNNDSYATSDTRRVNRKYTSTNVDELIAAGEVSFNSSWFNKDNFNNQLFPNAIDPTIYFDTDGKMYMCYGSWSGGIFSLEIDPATGKCIHPKTGTTSDGRMVDSYFGTKISGGYGKSGEGPFIEYNADTGYYYLWVTYGGLTSGGGYNMRVFRSESPTGPFKDPAGRNAVLPTNPNLDSTGLKVMGNYKFSSLAKAYMACGHNSVLRDDDGRWYLFYHARFDDGSEYHEVRVHEMFFNAEGWPVVAPFEYSGNAVSETGYEESSIAGDYEFINHGSSTDGKIISSQKITLNADHTISGAVTGTWEESPADAKATFFIGGQAYSGTFIAAENESGKAVMSFTAIGSNNQTVWGVKNDAYSPSERGSGRDLSDRNSPLINKAETVSGTGSDLYISGTDIISGAAYYITNLNSGMPVDIKNGELDEGTNIQQWSKNGLWAQQWRIISEPDGWCRIVSLGDESRCIAVAQTSAEDGVNIQLAEYTGDSRQLWKFVKNGSSYGIVSKCSDGTAGLDVYEWSKEAGGNINQWNYWGGECQLWNLTPVYPTVNEGSYTIRSLETGKYITVSEGRLTTGEAKSWNIVKEDEFFSVRDSSGKAVSPDSRGFILNSPGKVDNLFVFSANSDGTYSVIPAWTGINGALAVDDNGDITLEEQTGSRPQRFVIEPAQPEVYSEPPTEEPTDAPTEPPTEPETDTPTEPVRVLYGDANVDGSVNVADAVAVLQYVANQTKYALEPQGMINADIDGAEGITGTDAIVIQKLDAGIVKQEDLPLKK
ncbi:MAG: RICIN domain-containing protein [Ruminococcus sp.]|nr:RICIN domain-containing protein [Ruminococcus sp.]